MVRGKDAYGIESMAVALTVIDPVQAFPLDGLMA